MNPQLLALLTAIAWGVGGYFEKKGMNLGGLSPQMAITIRTAVALLILGGEPLTLKTLVGSFLTNAGIIVLTI
jgi:uncharacterized membrane protein